MLLCLRVVWGSSGGRKELYVLDSREENTAVTSECSSLRKVKTSESERGKRSAKRFGEIRCIPDYWRRQLKGKGWRSCPVFVTQSPGRWVWQPDDLHPVFEDTYPEIPTAVSFLPERTDIGLIGDSLDKAKLTSGSPMRV